MPADYHSYIYDTQGRRIIGDFEGAYANCADVWPSQHAIDQLKFDSVRWTLRRTGGPLLDIGAGYGDFVASLSRGGINAVGLEISATAVAQGQARHGAIDLRVGDVKEGLPFPDGSFKVVTMFGVMWFLLDALDDALAEIDRVMAADGLFAASIGIPVDPIGRERIASYADFVEILRRRFEVTETALLHDRDAMRAGLPLDQCPTDMLAWCAPRR